MSLSPSVSPAVNKGRGRPKKGFSFFELSDRYGVDVRTVRAWKRKGYPIEDEAATRALVAKQQKTSPHLADPSVGTSKERRENIQYEILKFKLEKDKGLHIPRDVVIADGQKIGAVLAATLESLPAELVSLLDGKSPGAMHKLLTERFRQIRIDIAAMADAVPEIPE